MSIDCPPAIRRTIRVVMFTPKVFDVDIVRELPAGRLRWPSEAEADEYAALAGNRHYADFRAVTWDDFDRIAVLEAECLQRILRGDVTEQQLIAELEDQADRVEEHALMWLDIG